MAGERHTILLVEPDILIRNPLAEYLRDCGYHVLEACSVDEAREHLAKPDRPIDLALCDAGLPDGGGFAFSAWVRREHPHVTVLLAGTVERAVEKAGALCEEGPALSKPYNHQFVLEHIRRLMASRGRN